MKGTSDRPIVYADELHTPDPSTGQPRLAGAQTVDVITHGSLGGSSEAMWIDDRVSGKSIGKDLVNAGGLEPNAQVNVHSCGAGNKPSPRCPNVFSNAFVDAFEHDKGSS